MDHTLAMILYASLQAGRRRTELRGDHSVTELMQVSFPIIQEHQSSLSALMRCSFWKLPDVAHLYMSVPLARAWAKHRFRPTYLYMMVTSPCTRSNVETIATDRWTLYLTTPMSHSVIGLTLGFITISPKCCCCCTSIKPLVASNST